MKLAPRYVAAIVLLLMSACSGPPATAQRSSPTSASTSAPSSSVRSASAAAYCPGLTPGDPLLIAWLRSDTTRAVVQDVQNPSRAVTLCAPPAGAPRFVSATVIAIWNPGDIFTVDLITGQRTQLLSYVHNDGPVPTVDWNPVQDAFSYGRETADGHSVAFHLVTAGSDRILSTITSSYIGVGATRVEFSPTGEFVALGSRGAAASGERASVQVRRLDGTLVFSADGTGQQTWAGESPRFYFESSTGVKVWDPDDRVQQLPVKTWRSPSASPGGRWLAYTTGDNPSELRLIDTRSGSDKLIARSLSGPEWVTASLLRFDVLVSCPPPPTTPVEANPCISKSVLYDLTDGTQSDSDLNHVFATWPRSTPSWS